MAKKKANEVIHEEGFVEVSSTVIGKTERKGSPLKVRPFVTTPAQVEVHMGTWFPTGEMRGAKLDITIRVPCYIEEISVVFKACRKLVDALMEREIKRMEGGEEDD